MISFSYSYQKPIYHFLSLWSFFTLSFSIIRIVIIISLDAAFNLKLALIQFWLQIIYLTKNWPCFGHIQVIYAMVEWRPEKSWESKHDTKKTSFKKIWCKSILHLLNIVSHEAPSHAWKATILTSFKVVPVKIFSDGIS